MCSLWFNRNSQIKKRSSLLAVSSCNLTSEIGLSFCTRHKNKNAKKSHQKACDFQNCLQLSWHWVEKYFFISCCIIALDALFVPAQCCFHQIRTTNLMEYEECPGVWGIFVAFFFLRFIIMKGILKYVLEQLIFETIILFS